MTSTIEVLWLRLQSILKVFVNGIVAADPRLMYDVGRTANDDFLLRAYLALRRQANGDELAITIDVRSDGQAMTLESDVCTDDGGLVANGPCTAVSLAGGQMEIETEIDHWLREFERFLIENQLVIATAASRLT